MRRVLQKIYTILIVFFCIAYFFASIGVLSYGGLINKSEINNPNYTALQNSPYGRNGFWGLNFNDFTGINCLYR
jgi:hypothetical protein